MKTIILVILFLNTMILQYAAIPFEITRTPTRVAQVTRVIPTSTKTQTATQTKTVLPTRTQTKMPEYSAGSGGITRTPTQITRELTPSPTAPYTDLGYITKIDYIAKTMQVTIRGSSGPAQILKIMSSVDIGTSDSPKVVPGNWAKIERIRNEYFVTGFQLDPSTSLGTPAAQSALATPSNFTVVQRGSSIYASWTPVPGAIAYELYENTTASPIGATLANGGNARTSNTDYNWTLNVGATSNLLANGDFETGDFTHWRLDEGAYSDMTVQSAVVYSGSYSLKSVRGAEISRLHHDLVAVTPSTDYIFSFYEKNLSATNLYELVISWYETETSASLRDDIFLGDYSTVHDWKKTSGKYVSPANAHFSKTQIVSGGNSGGDTEYLDDVSMVGLSSVLSTKNYAVRAIGSFGQASSFSTWLTPILQSQMLGGQSSYLQLTTEGKIVSSITNSPPVAAMSPEGFTSTGWEVPLNTENPVGWQTWTYASATTFTISGDYSGFYTAGMKLRLKQGGAYKYFTVVSSAYSSPNTTVTVSSPNSDTIANSAITDNYHSYMANPQAWTWGNSQPYVCVREEQSAGTHGGTFTSGAWRTRVLNTESSDTDSICTLSSNQITLSAGTYICRITAPASQVDRHKAILYNVTDSANVLIGTSEYSDATVRTTNHSIIEGKFTIAASKALEVRHQCASTFATTGLGWGYNFGVVEVFTVAEFWKVG